MASFQSSEILSSHKQVEIPWLGHAHVYLLLYKHKVWIIYYYSASDLDLCCIYAVNTLIWFSVLDTLELEPNLHNPKLHQWKWLVKHLCIAKEICLGQEHFPQQADSDDLIQVHKWLISNPEGFTPCVNHARCLQSLNKTWCRNFMSLFCCFLQAGGELKSRLLLFINLQEWSAFWCI